MTVSIHPAGTNEMRLAMAKAATGNGEKQSIIEYCEERWGKGAAVALLAREYVTRSAVPGHNTTGHSALAPTSSQLEVIKPVIERTVFRGATLVPLDVRIATVTGGGTATWMAEGEGIPLGQVGVTYETLRAKRLAVMGVITEEMLIHSGVEQILRNQFTSLIARAINDAALDPNNSGSATEPASLTNGVTVHETLSGMMDDFTGDLQRSIWYATPELFLAMQSNVNPDLGIGGGTYKGSVAIATRSAPANSLVLIDPAGVSLALGPLEIDSSKYATVVMDDNPSLTSVAPTAANVVDMFSTNSVALRAQQYINWTAAPGAVAMIEIEPGSPI